MQQAHGRKLGGVARLDWQAAGQHQVLRRGRPIPQEQRHFIVALSEASEPLDVILADGNGIDLETTIDVQHMHKRGSIFGADFGCRLPLNSVSRHAGLVRHQADFVHRNHRRQL